MSGKPVVWVLDDEPQCTTNTEKLLVAHGFESRGFVDAQAMIEEITAGVPPDLLLTDYHMPRMNGGAVLEALERIAHPRPLAICMTGAICDVPPDMRSRFDAMLEKPFRFAALLAVIDRVVASRAADDDE